MTNVKMEKKQKGFTLPELMVGLAISAIVALLAYGLIKTATPKSNVTRAADDITTISAAVVEWRSLKPSYSGLSMTAINNQGLVPDLIGDGTGKNPWGGNYVAQVNSSDSSKFDIPITGITDSGALASLEAKLDQASGNNASISGTTVTVTF